MKNIKKKYDAANHFLFGNPGKKIKEHSILIFWIEVVVCLVLAFVLGFHKEYYSYWFTSGGYWHTVFRPEYFFGFLLGGPLYAYASQLALVGFGELIENSAKQAAGRESTSEKCSEEKKAEEVPAAETPAAPVCEKEPAPAEEAAAAAEKGTGSAE